MRLRLMVLTIAAVLGSAVAASSASAKTSGYAIGVPACPVPARPSLARCDAMRRVTVKKTTPGARAFTDGAGAAPSAATIGPAGGLTPSDLATAYAFTSTTASTQKIALVDAYNDPDINADLQVFDKEYALTACSEANGCLKVVSQTGTSTLPPNDTTGWATEISLDVETAHSVCQHCTILLVEATDQSIANLAPAEDEAVKLGATEVSNSFGFPETQFTATDSAAFNHPGTVITASTGDNGWRNFDYLDEFGSVYNQPDAPSTLPTVVAVGGTSLYLGQTAARQSEAVWNDNGTKDYDQELTGDQLGAGGGGCSTISTAQSWQVRAAGFSQTGCGTKRSAADVSAVADYLTGFDIYLSDTCGGNCATGWQTIGGTSLASPLVASMWALAGGSHGTSYPSLDLYGHVGGSSLYDVTQGGNGWCDGEGAAACGDPNTAGNGVLDCDYPATGSTPSVGDRSCDALAGYDGPTGVGTPKGLGAFAKVSATAKIAGPVTIVHNTTGTWTATTTDPTPGATISSYKWNWGDATAITSTTTGSATHKYTAAATRTITLTVTDNYGQTGTATYSVKVT